DTPDVIEFARSSADGAKDDSDKAVKLFYAVRDGIKYNPYQVTISPEEFRASRVLAKKEGWCVEKAILLAAAARVFKIPSRLCCANIRNHLVSESLKEFMKTDLFVFHGFTELYLDGRWIKATPAFDIELCRRLDIYPVEFDGTKDAIFHKYDRGGNLHIEYVDDLGSFADLPLEQIIEAFKKYYPHFFDESAPVKW
ncbi:MAG: transglutaminase-like domain-containing protein, partial [Thermodesulfobacteriota bacterium]|nr:transglutaminase-like domain-containing protein [Thermodesulfobacteriota bacterium]